MKQNSNNPHKEVKSEPEMSFFLNRRPSRSGPRCLRYLIETFSNETGDADADGREQ